jgi:hypothetical protein
MARSTSGTSTPDLKAAKWGGEGKTPLNYKALSRQLNVPVIHNDVRYKVRHSATLTTVFRSRTTQYRWQNAPVIRIDLYTDYLANPA